MIFVTKGRFMTPEQISERIKTNLKDSRVEIADLTGTRDHYQATIASDVFKGKLMIDQHRLIYKLFEKEIASGELHALTLKTYSL